MKKHFTLVELLIVMMILAILCSILFPVLKTAMDSARKIQCNGNLKNIAVTWFGYGQDYDGRLPSVFESYRNPATTTYYENTTTWVQVMYFDHFTQLEPYKIGTGTGKINPAKCKDIKELVCPSKKRRFDSNSTPAALSTYSMCPWGVGGKTYLYNNVGPYEAWPRVVSITLPSQRAVLLDSTQFNFIPGTTGNMDRRHRDAANFLYADGHTGILTFPFMDSGYAQYRAMPEWMTLWTSIPR